MELTGFSRLALLATDPNGNCVLGCLDSGSNLEPNDGFYSDTDLEGAPTPNIGSGWVAMAVAGLMGFGARRRLRHWILYATRPFPILTPAKNCGNSNFQC